MVNERDLERQKPADPLVKTDTKENHNPWGRSEEELQAMEQLIDKLLG